MHNQSTVNHAKRTALHFSVIVPVLHRITSYFVQVTNLIETLVSQQLPRNANILYNQALYNTTQYNTIQYNIIIIIHDRVLPLVGS